MIKLVLISMLSFNLFAGFLNGEWQGKGSVSVISGGVKDTNPCDKVIFSIRHDSKTLQVKKGKFNCSDGMVKSFEPFSAEIEKGKLYFDGENIGNITNENLEAEFEDFFSGTVYKISAKVIDQTKISIYQSETSFFGYTVAAEAVLEI